MKVVLTHLWPESNTGDWAIVKGQIQSLRAVAPDVAFTGITTFMSHSERLAGHFAETLASGVTLRPAVVPSYLNDACAQFGTRAKILSGIKYLCVFLLLRARCLSLACRFFSRSQRETLREVRNADLVLIKGGAYVMGFPGLKGTMYLLRNTLSIYLFSSLNPNCVFAPHSFGPFAGGHQLRLLTIVLSRVRIMVRERLSQATLREAGLSSEFVPDMAFSLDLSNVALPARDPRLLTVTVRPCPTFLTTAQQSAYYEVMAEALARLCELGYRVLFIPQVTGPDHREDDRAAIRELCLRLKADARANGRVDTCDVVTLEDKLRRYASSACCIGTRMHSVILSTLVGTRVVAIGYLGPKHRGIMADLELQAYVLDIEALDPGALVATVMAALSEQHVETTTRRVLHMRRQIHNTFRELVSRLD